MSDKPLIVDGIRLSVTAEDFSDIEYLEQAVIAADESRSDSERVIASVRMLQVAFGADWQRVKEELRAKSADGRLTLGDINAFVQKIGEALKVKN